MLLPWSSRSPILKIIENMWSMLSSRVYDGPQPKKNKQELEERVYEAVDHMSSHLSEYVETLFSSLHSRFLYVTRNGNKVSY